LAKFDIKKVIHGDKLPNEISGKINADELIYKNGSPMEKLIIQKAAQKGLNKNGVGRMFGRR
jgi:hypothetical protein